MNNSLALARARNARHYVLSFAVPLALVSLSIAGAILALNASFNLMPLFSDEVMLAALTKGVMHHGFGFLSTWRFTSDNYTLDAWPVLASIYLLFGYSPSVIVASGWVFYIANAIGLGLVAYRFVSWRWSLVVVTLCLLFSGQALTTIGFLEFTVSHDSTWTLALCGWLLLLWKRPTDLWRPLLLLVIFCGTVSDPWFDAAFTFPVVITLWLQNRYGPDSYKNPGLVKAIVYTYLSARILYWLVGEKVLRCFPGRGAGLDFTHIPLHALWIMRDVSGLLGIPDHPAFVMIGLVVWVAALVRLLAGAFLQESTTPAHVTLLSVGVLSVGGLLAAGLLDSLTNNIMSGRYFINVVYILLLFGVIGIAMAAKQRAYGATSIVVAGLIVFSAVGFQSLLVTPFSLTPRSVGDHALFSALAKRHLGAGFGPYFMGVNSNTTDIWDGGRRRVFPVLIKHHGEIALWYVQTSRRWFEPKRDKKPTREFLVMPLGGSPNWRQAAMRTFGKPAGVLDIGPFRVWVWNKHLRKVMRENQVAHRKAWHKFNIIRNRAVISRVSNILGISDKGLQRIYSWLLIHHWAD